MKTLAEESDKNPYNAPVGPVTEEGISLRVFMDILYGPDAPGQLEKDLSVAKSGL